MLFGRKIVHIKCMVLKETRGAEYIIWDKRRTESNIQCARPEFSQ